MFSKFKENKWLLAFTITCVVLLAAIIVAIVLGVALAKSNETPEYSEGPEIGIYYYDVADGEIVLTLSGGNNFAIAGPGYNKMGTYVATESGLTLDFVRDEDGEATAVASGNTVEVTLSDGTKMTFLKKINYTVSFNVDGSSVTTATVVNGKTVAKPADPTKDGFVFLGWYADAELTVPYAFDSTIIKDNTIVYAKFAAKGPEGSSEYTISFDLGYEGAAAMNSIETIGAKAYGVTAPTRDGYTFCGWWISMYDDSTKLSYAYTEDTVFNADTTLYAVWHEDATGKLIAPMASVSGNSVKWDSVNGAVSYTVIITDANGAEVENKSNIGTTNYSFDFSKYPAGEYTVSVVAVSADSSKTSEAAVRSYANKTLDRVTDFTVINGNVIYNSVQGAEKCYVTVECGDPAHKHNMFDNGTSTVFSIANCSMQKGGIKITVTATAKGYADSVSKTFVYEKNLDAITSVTYDAASDAFVWFPVENATSYFVELTYGDKTYSANIGNKTSFSLANYSGALTVKVTPVTEGYNSPDATTTTFTKTAPAAPTGLTISGYTITWDAVEGATSYVVKIGNASYTTDTNSYTVATEGLVVGDYYAISVQAIAATGASAFSSTVNAGYLVMDPIVNYTKNTVTWTPVLGATNYLVRVNGGATVSVNGTSTTVKLTKSGVNTIEVKYTDLGGSKWVSTQVYAYAVTYMSRSLSGEVTEYLAIGDALSLPTTFENNGFDFDGWYNTPNGADGNGKKVEEAIFSGTNDITLYANWTPKTYKVELQTGGYDITNITDKTKVDATYTKDFVLPVPETSNTKLGTFLGWYTAANGDGEQLTDEDGNSVITYPFARDTVAYPFFDNGVLSYVQKKDGTYAVRRGQYINKVKSVTIPEYYNGAKVTTVLENAFADCTRLVSIEIPDTIELIGTGAFSGCTRLESINIYEVEGNHVRNYLSDDGVLVYRDLGGDGATYLEVVPRAKTGTYVMCEEIQVIRNKAFNYSQLESVVISKSVTTIASRAFNYCTALESVDFVEGRTANVTFENDSFYRCNNVKSMKIPAALENVNIDMLQSLTALSTITVEKGHANYSSVAGLLTNALEDTIVFVPAAFISGDFTIPTGIQHIGDRAFQNCAGITNVTIPNYVKSIGDYAFNRCSGIKTVTFNGDRKQNDLTIGDYAFAACSKLTSVTIGGSADGKTLDGGKITIGTGAFMPVSKLDAKLNSFTIGNGANIAKIGDNAFQNQALLSTLDFGTAFVGEIGAYAFSNCSNINAVTIPKDTTVVGARAFENCTGIASMSIAEGSTTLAFGEYAFAGCVRLTTVNLPASVSNFDGAVFSGCNALKAIVVDPANTNLKSENGVLYDFNLTTLKFYPVALVVEKAGVIGEADLPATLTTIDKAVFIGNTDLKSIVIGANVTKIADEAFSGCSNLTSVTFKHSESADATLTIGNDAFNKCGFTNIDTLPSYTTTIGARAFYGSKFQSFPTPAKLVTIGADAFKGNTKLSAITITANVSSIADGAFSGCTGLKTLTIEDGETPLTIGTPDAGAAASGAFYNTRIATIDLPDRVTSIGAYAFTTWSYSTSNNKLTSFTAGANLKYIGKNAFRCAVRLADVTLNEGLEVIDDYAFGETAYNRYGSKYGLTSIEIPSTVTKIGAYAFGATGTYSYYNILDTVTFAKGGTAPISISPNAFAWAHITDIEIPARALAYTEADADKSLYGIGEKDGLVYKTFSQIFNNCTTLANITVEEGSTQFKSINGILYVLDANGVASTLLYCPLANKGVDGVVTIPNTVNVVEDCAFLNTTGIHTVIFEEATDPNASLYIGNFVPTDEWNTSSETYGIFAGANNTITKVVLPKHLDYIGSCAFALRGTSAAQDVVLQFNLEAEVEIATYAFQYVDTLALNLPKVSSIHGRYYMEYLTAETITFAAGSTFTSMPKYGIAYCNNLKSFEVPATVISLGSNAIFDCTSLTAITFAPGSALQTVGTAAFDGCESLKSITFPESVVEIGTSVFSGCASLESVVLPAGIKGISAATFDIGMTGGFNSVPIIPKLSSITFSGESQNYKVVNGAIYTKDGERLVYFPAGKIVDEFTVADGVKYIDDKAFYVFQGKTVNLPTGLEEIGQSAFAYSALETITIPASIKVIGPEAFRESRSLTTFTMDRNSPILELGHVYSGYNNNGIFQNCVSLKNVTLSDNIQYIGNHAFSGCAELESIILPAALKAINTHTFYRCAKLSAIQLPASVESIGNQSFYGAALESVTIPAAVKMIDNFAFIDNAKLTSVIFEKDSVLESIGNQVFKNCVKLTSIDLSVAADLTTIGTAMFEGDTELTTIKLNGTAIVELPANIFKDLTALTTVTLPENLETIGASAYAGATALESVTIPASVHTIGTSAFENCTALKTVTFAEGSAMTVLGTATAANDNIFKGTTALETVTLPMGLELIGGHVFENSGVQKIYQNNGIEEVSLPAALTTIGDYAFANCDRLTDVVIYGNTGYIGGYAFNDCDELKTLTLSEGVSFIGSLAFGYCEQLQAVALPQTITRLDGNPFAGCIGLTSFTLHEDNTAYKFIDGILYDWTAYTLVFNPVSNTATSLQLPDTVYEIAAGAFVGSHIQSLVLPSKITTVPDYAFANCEDLVSVKLSNSITSIGNYAFNGCTKLNNVIIPKSVNSIGNYAFANCTTLNSFVFEDKDDTDAAYALGTNLFDGCAGMTTVTVPNKIAGGKLPAYMFTNTGLVNAVVPASVTNLNSVGVFANNEKLETVKFEGVCFFDATIGSRFFENCTALTTIIDNDDRTPDNMADIINSYAFAGCTSLKEFTLYGNDGYSCIESYGFAGCTGLTNFYFTTGDNYGVSAYDHLADYAFKDCTGIETLYLPGGSPDAYDVYYNNVFDGWTANQTIIFLNDLEGFPRYGHSGWDKKYLDGCNAKIVWQDEFFSKETVELQFFTHFEYNELTPYAGVVKTLNIYDIGFNHNNSNWGKKSLYSSAFNGWTAEQTINFKNYSYQEILAFFTDGLFDAAAFKGCAAKVCDKDGNVLVIDVTTGEITAVTNADGSTTLWTPAA